MSVILPTLFGDHIEIPCQASDLAPHPSLERLKNVKDLLTLVDRAEDITTLKNTMNTALSNILSYTLFGNSKLVTLVEKALFTPKSLPRSNHSNVPAQDARLRTRTK